MGKYQPKDWKSIDSGEKPLTGNVTDRVVEDYMAHHGKIKQPRISGRKLTSPKKRLQGSIPKGQDLADALGKYGKKGSKHMKVRGAKARREATTEAAEDFVNSLDLSGIGKAEEKEQAMDQEEDLEDLTDGELEEVEKKLEGVKRKLRNLVTSPDVYPSELKNQKQLKEHKEQVKDVKNILNEAEDEVRLDSRETQAMYKSKMPKKVRPESPNKENSYQTHINKPIQWKALKDKIQVKKTWEIWLENKADTQTRRSQNPRTSVDGESVDNTHAGKTELPDTFGNLAYGSYKRDSPTDTDKRIKLRLDPHRPKIGRPKGDRGVENKLTRDQAKIQSDSLVHQMFHDPEGFKKRIGLPTGQKPEPDVEKKPQSKEPPKEEPEWAKRVRAGGGKPQLRGKAENSFEKKIRELHRISMDDNEDYGKGTKPNLWFGDPIGDQKENKGKQGKINEILKSWEIWLEKKKDQGQGDARYGNVHETGMEDPRKLQVTRDDFSMEDEKEKDEKKEDNKPYKERDHKSE